MNISGANFVVTGGNRGIGLAVCKMAARKGANLFVVARSLDFQLEQELKLLGAKTVRFLKADLSTRAGTEELAIILKSMEVDILFNNAGLLTGGLLEEQSLDEIYNMFQVNLNALVHLTRAVIPGMTQRKRGKIVNNSSVSAFMHFPCASTYAASKAAVVAFTNCLQAELMGTGVTTLCLITPGIKTRMFDDIEVKYAKHFEVPKDSISPDQYAEMVARAIESDIKDLFPKGLTRVGLIFSRYLNSLFKIVVANRFQRNPNRA